MRVEPEAQARRMDHTDQSLTKSTPPIPPPFTHIPATGFDAILHTLVESVPGAMLAIFADYDGESVAHVGRDLPALEVQIIGAQWGVVWSDVKRAFDRARLGGPREVIIDGPRGSALIHRVTDQYYLVLVLGPEGHLAKAFVETVRSAAALVAEM